MNFTTVVSQVAMLGVIILFGFIISATGYVNIKIKDSISKLIVKLVLPCLIISSISEKTFVPELAGELFAVFLMTLFCIFVMFMTGTLTAKLLHVPQPSRAVHKLLSSLGNVIFIGYPVIVAMYGEDGFFYGIIYWLVNDLFLWTVGVLMMSKNHGSKKAFLLKLFNPNTVSFALALFMFFNGIKLPPVIAPAIKAVGDLTVPLSMIFIGMALSGVKLKSIFTKWWIFILTPIKLIALPILFIFIFKQFDIKDMIIGVVVLEAAMPAQTVLSILANEQKCDADYAAIGMFITTLASLFTLPLVCRFIEIWL